MSEEVKNAATVVPISMLWAIGFNGCLAFAMFLAVLFCIGDLDAVLSSSYTFPFIEVLLQATDSIAGTAVIIVLLLIIDIALVIGVTAAASRMLWSFARDKGVPGWRWLMQVRCSHSRTCPVCQLHFHAYVSYLFVPIISMASHTYQSGIAADRCSRLTQKLRYPRDQSSLQ